MSNPLFNLDSKWETSGTFTPNAHANVIYTVATQIAKDRGVSLPSYLISDDGNAIQKLRVKAKYKPKTLEECGVMFDNAEVTAEKLSVEIINSAIKLVDRSAKAI